MCCFRIGTSKVPAKQSQHVNATYRNIVGRNMLRAFSHRVATSCDMSGVVDLSLEMVKFEPTTPNMSQHIATRWPLLRSTMLRYVVLTCCDRLAGALEVPILKQDIISRHFFSTLSSRCELFKVVHPKRYHNCFCFPFLTPKR